MKKIFITFIIISTFSCNTLPKCFLKISGEVPEIINENCEHVFELISKNWAVFAFDKNEENCFYYNRNVIMKIIEKKTCFIGMNKKELIGLLGNPSHTTIDNYFYYLSNDCEGANNIKPYLRFTLKEKVEELFFDPVIPIN